MVFTPTTPNPMAKPNPSKNALKHTFAVILVLNQKNGAIGYHLLNGGTTPIITLLLGSLPLRQSTAMILLPCFLMCEVPSPTWR